MEPMEEVFRTAVPEDVESLVARLEGSGCTPQGRTAEDDPTVWRILVPKEEVARARACVEAWGAEPPDGSEPRAAPVGLFPRHAIGLFLANLGFQVAGGVVIGFLGLSMAVGLVFVLTVSSILTVGLARGMVGGRFTADARRWIGLVHSSSRSLVAGGVLGIAAILCNYWVSMHVPVPADAEPNWLVTTAQGSRGGMLAVFAIAILVAPAIEEFLFRGVMFEGLRRRWGTFASAAVVTLIFAAMHIEVPLYWPSLAFVGLLGALAVWLRIRTGSIYPGMAAHVGFNLVSTILIYDWAERFW